LAPLSRRGSLSWRRFPRRRVSSPHRPCRKRSEESIQRHDIPDSSLDWDRAAPVLVVVLAQEQRSPIKVPQVRDRRSRDGDHAIHGPPPISRLKCGDQTRGTDMFGCRAWVTVCSSSGDLTVARLTSAQQEPDSWERPRCDLAGRRQRSRTASDWLGQPVPRRGDFAERCRLLLRLGKKSVSENTEVMGKKCRRWGGHAKSLG